MREVEIVNLTNPFEGRITAGYCVSFFCRLKGLMFRRSIPADWGLLLVQNSDSIINSAIHMVAVPFDLGIVWVNDAQQVVDTVVAKRWVGMKSPKAPARYTLEVQPFQLSKFQPGDKVDFVEI